MGKAASLRVADFVDALPMPVDGNFEWKEPRFTLFEYKKKTGEVVATTTACRVTFVGKDGTEYIQHYSVGDPDRVLPSRDGKQVELTGEGGNLNKSSNFFVLMKALEDAGLDPDFVGDDVSVLEGLVTHNIAVPEPKREGLRAAPAAGETQRVRLLPVPDAIISLPGAKKKGAAPKKGVATSAELVDEAIAMLGALIESSEGAVTKSDLASYAIRNKRSPVAAVAYNLTPEQLAKAGYVEEEDGSIVAVGE